MHLEIPQAPFSSCAMDFIGQLPTTSKGNIFALTFICLLTFYLITVPLKTKTADKVFTVYIKEILPKTSCRYFRHQENIQQSLLPQRLQQNLEHSQLPEEDYGQIHVWQSTQMG